MGASRKRRAIIKRKLWADMPAMKDILPLAALPKGNGDRIVCRCEQVTEAVILDSLGRGLPVVDTDGVKYRTRAGMGMCQGAFCQPRVAQLIADFNQMPLEQVILAQPGSGKVSIKDLKSKIAEIIA